MKKPKSQPQNERRCQSAEDALRKSEEQFRGVFEKSGVAKSITALDGRLLHVNQAFADLIGYSIAEMETLNFADITHPADLAASKDAIRSLMAGEQIFIRFEKRYFHRSGRLIWADVSTTLIHDDQGEPLCLAASIVDISDRKRAEAALLASEQEKALILDGIDDIIAYHDTQMCLVWANRAYLRGIAAITGIPVRIEDVRGRHCCEAWKLAKPCIGCPVRIALETGKANEAELTPQNQPQWPATQGSWLVRATPVHDVQGNIIGAIEISQNITERKKLEADRLAFESRLHQAQRLESLGVLAGGIAHDFNNILMGIMGNADLALDGLSPLSPVRESLTEIVHASKRAAELCGQMLAYAGKGRIEQCNISLGALVEETLHLLKTCISKKAILNLNLEKELPCMYGDPSQIRQILMNLVINASEAIGERSGVITLSSGAMDCSEQYLASGYIVAPGKPGIYVFIEVSDTGCGMDKKTIERIFDPFFTTKFAGRGLGLSAVMGVVNAHKGALRVYSEPGKGSTFKVMFPAIDASVEKGAEADASSAWCGRGTVLLVDDEETIRALGSKQLHRLGLEVLTAEDGRQAVDLYRECRADIVLVLLDLTMPHMNGEEAFRALRQIDPEVRVIMASGYGENDIVARFAGKGLAGCLQKPYTLTKLRALLSTLLPQAESAPPLEGRPGPGKTQDGDGD